MRWGRWGGDGVEGVPCFGAEGMFVRTWGLGWFGWAVLGLAVGVYAGVVLSAVVVCVSRIFSLSLLATVRGGTSFLCPKRQRNEAKKALLKPATLSVHSVQFSFIGAPKARCSPERRMFEPLLLANPDTNTLRPQRSRASTSCQGIGTALTVFGECFHRAVCPLTELPPPPACPAIRLPATYIQRSNPSSHLPSIAPVVAASQPTAAPHPEQ